MNDKSTEIVSEMLARGDKKFRNMKLSGASFAGKDLKGADFRGASLPGADFTGADLTYANFEAANCTMANFKDAKCHRTNFKDADLSHSIMEPTDLLGATFTMECKSFQGMKISPGWWFGWLFYGLLMQPPSNDLRDKLIALMGVERYNVLRKQYVRRQL